jgi:hypothetical protein
LVSGTEPLVSETEPSVNGTEPLLSEMESSLR